MQKTLIIDGREVKMRASALIPRIYRHMFRRDVIHDMTKLRKAFNKRNELPEDATEEQIQEAQLSEMDLEIFEDIAFLMAKLGQDSDDEPIPDTPDEWLDSFKMFSIYEILPQILELWEISQQSTAIPKKK